MSLQVDIILHDKNFDLIRQIIREEMRALHENLQEERLLSPSEVSKMLSVSLVTLRTWSNEGRIARLRIGKRIYYKYSEVMNALKVLKKYKKSIND